MAKDNENVLALVTDPASVLEVQKHADIRQRVLELRHQVEDSYWELSQVVYGVYKESLYQNWGFKTWKDWVETELDFAVRKAQYLVSIQDWFGKMSPSVQTWIHSLGWTKAKELVRVVDNNNAAEWQKRIEGKTLTQIVEMVKGKGDAPVEFDDEEDNAGDGVKVEKPKEETTVKMTFALFSEQKRNVDAALAHASSIAESDKACHLIDLICTAYLAQNSGVESSVDFLINIERMLGISLIGYDHKSQSITFGGDTLDQIVQNMDGAPVEE